ncbi:MAG: exodeoxyribonuclease VII small subunit [Bacteroidales bacterium]|nr:exodeoxyribonuclease VII small subunit [Bacteroidales bacterium]
MEKKTYKAAMEELESILASIEQGDMDVDDMLKKVGRATELIRFCRQKLTQTDEAVQKLMEEIR